MRLILYLGKGGVGKTTIAAATAIRCSKLGYRTLIVSTDVAHSLADVFDAAIGSAPTRMADNLWAQEINVLDEIREDWHGLWVHLTTILRQRGMGKAIAEELAIVPGMEEITSLLHIYRQSQTQAFDVIVIDAAPTGETLRLLTVPETFQWYSSGLIQKNSAPNKLGQAFGFSPNDEVLELLSNIETEMKALRQLLTDSSVSSYRVVFNPEKIVIKETQRAITYLSLFGYPVDAGIINRVMPTESASNTYWQRLQENQQHYLSVSQDTFSPLPLFRAAWDNEEVIGISALEKLSQSLWLDRDPAQVFWQGKTQRIEEEGEEYIFCLPLSHVSAGKVDVTKRSDELFITIGNFKREITLPTALAVRHVTAAQLTSEGTLKIRFLATQS
ncbi:MAG: ArsA family ATPase [Cyanobacteria bacterium P01_D01_bin.56]